jgi:deoxyribose-phosphate aldolase
MMTKILESIEQYPIITDHEIEIGLTSLYQEKIPQTRNQSIYKKLFSCVDLTSLNTLDNDEQLADLTEKINFFEEAYPEIPSVAAVCVYPSHVKTIQDILTEPVHIATVTGGFPHAQTFQEIKIAEASLAIMDGADEIDMVMPIGKLAEKKYDEIMDEIMELKSACGTATVKVILETGLLSHEDIRVASILALEAGADFIKTATGKLTPAATPEAAWIMCRMIATYHQLSGRKVGFKAAGGISTTEDALIYYSLVEELLGKEWLTKELFRIGASRLANQLLSDITGEPLSYF